MQGVDKRIDKYQYNTANVLGTGSYGTVYKGVNYLTKDVVALKMMPRNLINEPDKLIKEIAILQKLQGPNIVRLIETLQTQNNYYQVFTICETDLQAILKKEKIFTEAYAIKLMVDLLSGFLELIQNGIIHRDVKPANIMFGGGNFKLADFGFARMVDNYAGQRFVTILGTPLYMSPEILQDQPYTSKSDIWSLGFIFYEVLFGTTPWTAKSIPELIDNIHNKPLMFPDGIKKVSDLSKDVIRKCLIINENERIGWYDLYKHPLFESYFQNMKDLKQRCDEKAKFIVNKIRGIILKMDISIEDLLIKLMIPQEIGIKDIESLFRKVDNQLTRIETEHMFNDMAQGKITITVDQFKQWLVYQEIPFQSTRLQQQQSQGGIECIVSIKTAIKKFNQTSEKYFNKYNTEQDGKLKYQQFKLLVLRIDKGLSEAEIQDSFHLFDSQNNGYITKEEFDSLIDKYELP